jgi:hypothetical protein
MTTVVVFTSNNARIVKTQDSEFYRSQPNCVIDPDLTLVRGVAPHYWKLVNGVIKPMTPGECNARNERLAVVDNEIPVPPSKSVVEVVVSSPEVPTTVTGPGFLKRLILAVLRFLRIL